MSTHTRGAGTPISRRTFLGHSAAATAALAGAPAWPAETPPPGKRPNVVVIMADDMGWSDLGCYGGEIDTPNLDRLAAGGLRFRQFYNNAKCAPTRASLLTGLYSQQVGCHNGPERMRNCATVAEVLGTAGYKNYMAGKWHAEELPTQRGFDRYFGLADGCCNFFNPGRQRAGEPPPAEKNFPRKFARDGEVLQPFTPEDPDFFTTDAFTDAALEHLAGHPEDTPFFLYLAYTAPHYPLHAPEADIEKYRGRYRGGWDALRRERHARQIEMGLVDPDWGLAPRDERVPAWEDISDLGNWAREFTARRYGLTPEQCTSADWWDRTMAVYAAMVDRMDRNIGRVLDAIAARGELDNTLILFLSDNGGCAEFRHQTPEVPPGPAHGYHTCDPPWANAQNTPWRKYKRYDHEGGIATPCIAHWPARIAPNTQSDAVAHIIDLMPTALELSGATYPTENHGERVPPLEGQSLLPLLDGGAGDADRTLCWQFSQAAAIRQGDWKLVVDGKEPWELYNLREDRTELNNRAPAEAPRAQAMRTAWREWAERCDAHLPREPRPV